jgi:hypothetical protein
VVLCVLMSEWVADIERSERGGEKSEMGRSELNLYIEMGGAGEVG